VCSHPLPAAPAPDWRTPRPQISRDPVIADIGVPQLDRWPRAHRESELGSEPLELAVETSAYGKPMGFIWGGRLPAQAGFLRGPAAGSRIRSPNRQRTPTE